MAGKRRSREEADQEAGLTGFQQQPAAPPAAGGGLPPEAMEQLKSLAQLHDQGILTDQEFDQQKAKVLGT